MHQGEYLVFKSAESNTQSYLIQQKLTHEAAKFSFTITQVLYVLEQK